MIVFFAFVYFYSKAIPELNKNKTYAIRNFMKMHWTTKLNKMLFNVFCNLIQDLQTSWKEIKQLFFLPLEQNKWGASQPEQEKWFPPSWCLSDKNSVTRP